MVERYGHDDFASFSGANWWYESRRRILSRLLSKYVGGERACAIDLGCGVGSNAPALMPFSRRLIGVDISPEALQYAKDSGYDSLLEASATDVPLPDNSADIIMCTDVLEHIDDEQGISEIRRLLVPGGLAFITVPAFPSLWNENDDFNHHMRRYRRRELRERLKKHGFIIRDFSYWNLAFFLPVWLVARVYRKKPEGQRLANNLSRIPVWLNRFIIAWMAVENRVAAVIPLPIGVSEVLVVERP